MAGVSAVLTTAGDNLNSDITSLGSVSGDVTFAAMEQFFQFIALFVTYSFAGALGTSLKSLNEDERIDILSKLGASAARRMQKAMKGKSARRVNFRHCNCFFDVVAACCVAVCHPSKSGTKDDDSTERAKRDVFQYAKIKLLDKTKKIAQAFTSHQPVFKVTKPDKIGQQEALKLLQKLSGLNLRPTIVSDAAFCVWQAYWGVGRSVNDCTVQLNTLVKGALACKQMLQDLPVNVVVLRRGTALTFFNDPLKRSRKYLKVHLFSKNTIFYLKISETALEKNDLTLADLEDPTSSSWLNEWVVTKSA
eukprot:TRINITY_DN8424_c0_g1_i1.p1 TRINITY_DN8424_c0_g1~~TRINITY_DN8424_c0_g1_i1.p1  ORF type:complete len:306 (-),score=47.18 TRINITY_DN8424_c0_g1_i1:64-981(-)